MGRDVGAAGRAVERLIAEIRQMHQGMVHGGELLILDGLIETRRGVVRVTDRGGLKRHACECYQRLEDHFSAVIGSSGRGTA